MPSDIFRFGTAGIYQYPLSEVKIDTYTARYRYLPENNPLVDLSTGLWMTEAKSDMLTSVLAPRSQAYRSDRNWTRQDNRRIGGDLNNVARFETDFGDFKLDLGGSFQVEDIQPQKSVVTTLHDINANRTLRDATRQEYGLNGKLEFKPVERLTLWGGGRYSHFNSKDNGISASPRREDRDMRFITVSRPGYYGSMMWFPDQNGQYTDATDPRLNNGIVTNNTNNPFEGIPFDEFGPANVTVHPSRVTNVVTGYNYSKKGSSRGGGFSPAFGINFELAPDTFVYASYTEGLRLPSLFETSQGTLQVEPGKDLKPERSRSWEIGASAARQPVGRRRLGGDQAGLLQQHHQELHHPLLRSGPDGPDDLQQHRQLPHQRSRTAIALRRRAGVRRPVGDLLPEDRDLRRRLRRQAARRRQPLPAHREHAELHTGQLHGLLYQHAEPAAAGDQPDRRPALRPGP